MKPGLTDGLVLAGLGLIVAGVWQIYAPAAYIIGGLGVAAFALWLLPD